jgi:hypothetical protein
VELRRLEYFVALGRELGEHRLHHAARRTPRGGEVDQHGQLGLEHTGGEAVVGHVGNRLYLRHLTRVRPRAGSSKSNS